MVRKKNTSNDDNFKYSINQSFENLQAVQKMALNKKGKDDELSPDISIFLKAEELKGKLCGLYSEKSKPLAPINIMNSVFIDSKELSVNVGEKPAENSMEVDFYAD